MGCTIRHCRYFYNSLLLSENIEKEEFEPGTVTIVQKEIDTKNLIDGSYKAIITLNYENEKIIIEKDIFIGMPEIEIIGIQTNFIKQGENGKIIIELKNKYQGNITNVHAKLHIKKQIIETEPITIETLKNDILNLNFDTNNFEYGIYKANLEIFYSGYSTKNTIELYILPRNIDYLFAGIIVFIIISITIFLIHFRGKLP